MGQDQRHLDPHVVAALLERLSPAADDLVLIGGQALALWTERYESAPELQQSGPFTSKERPSAIRRCVSILRGVAHRRPLTQRGM